MLEDDVPGHLQGPDARQRATRITYIQRTRYVKDTFIFSRKMRKINYNKILYKYGISSTKPQ